MKSSSVGAEMFHADRRTDMAKLIVALYNFANTLNKSLYLQNSEASQTLFNYLLTTIFLSSLDFLSLSTYQIQVLWTEDNNFSVISCDSRKLNLYFLYVVPDINISIL
jgi:hypothetical protein